MLRLTELKLPLNHSPGAIEAAVVAHFGIAADETLTSKIDKGIGKIPQKYSGFAAVLEAAKTAIVKKALDPEQCEIVSCVWPTPPESSDAKVDVKVLGNDGGAITECKTGNGEGVVLGVFCP